MDLCGIHWGRYQLSAGFGADCRDAECVALCGGDGYDDFGEGTAGIFSEKLSSYDWTTSDGT